MQNYLMVCLEYEQAQEAESFLGKYTREQGFRLSELAKAQEAN